MKEHGLKLDQHELYQRADGATASPCITSMPCLGPSNYSPTPLLSSWWRTTIIQPRLPRLLRACSTYSGRGRERISCQCLERQWIQGQGGRSLRSRRTEFFPGLGWLLPRRLYLGELEAKWPTAHWDHWLRSEPINRAERSSIRGTAHVS